MSEGINLVKEPALSRKAHLHADTRLGYVHLTVSDLESSVAFYHRALGFQVHRQEDSKAYLGAGQDDLLLLTENAAAVYVPRRTGLYHFAILTPSRLVLAKVLQNLIETETPLQGGADHLVSEALYLSDPDGNGIEIYRDRPRSDWEYENGILKMGTEPLDYQGILAELGDDDGSWTGLEVETRLGHMHLHVADLEHATNFYEKVLGFDFLLTYMGTASFLSAGGYHHHIGLNTWNGVEAPPPPPDAVGLRYFTVQLANGDEREQLVNLLEKAEVNFEELKEGFFVRDPSQNGILFVS